MATDGRSERVLFWLQLESWKAAEIDRSGLSGSAHFSSPPSLTATKPNMRFNRLALGAAAVLGLCSVPGEYHCAMSVMVLILSYSILSLGGTVMGHGVTEGPPPMDLISFCHLFVFDDDNKMTDSLAPSDDLLLPCQSFTPTTRPPLPPLMMPPPPTSHRREPSPTSSMPRSTKCSTL